jgi:Predicted membrane protein
MEWIALWLGVEATGPPGGARRPGDDHVGRPRNPLLYLEVLGVVLLVLGAFWSYALLRIDWELRWYMTTDRSLRIREGTWRVREKTLTLTNVQNVTVHENPVQRLLGIANVRVRTAGGGTAPRTTRTGTRKRTTSSTSPS